MSFIATAIMWIRDGMALGKGHYHGQGTYACWEQRQLALALATCNRQTCNSPLATFLPLLWRKSAKRFYAGDYYA